ncbi:MAG TPA: response regulator [Candidatus Bathyarchaeia archaeon]|nr:response regulator [Candidatus Bathyarchaeia archaeon]
MEKKKILIVEDEHDLRELLAELLTNAGYEVYQAINGEVALERIKDFNPNLIITDILMPKLGGDALVKAVRESSTFRKIPFIILTERKLMKDYFDDLEIDEFIPKPFQTQDLLDKITSVFTKQQALLKKYDPVAGSDATASEDETHGKKICKKCGEHVDPSFFRCPNCGSMHFHQEK